MLQGVAVDSFWTKMALHERALTGRELLCMAQLRSAAPNMYFSAIVALGIEERESRSEAANLPRLSDTVMATRRRCVPDYEVQNDLVTVEGFVHPAAGITCIAERDPRSGIGKSSDLVIKPGSCSKLHDQPALDSMTMVEMTDLVRVLRDCEIH